MTVRPLSLLLTLALVACNGDKPDDTGDTDTDTDTQVVDADDDGFPEGEDCDDTNASVNPDADEICNGIDDNCDQVTDDDAVDQGTWYTDADNDGWGDPTTATTACEAGDDQVDNGEDCDDTTELRGPTVIEICNDIDDDCDDQVDEDAADPTTWYTDADGDTFGDDATAVEACDAPTGGEVTVGGDCDDAAAGVYPGAAEVCDGVDQDCDAGTVDAGVWHEDGGAWTDLTSVVAAGADGAPAAVTVPSGTLHVCDGTWFTTVSVTGSATLVGHGSTDTPILDGGGMGSVVSVLVDGVDLTVEGLALAGGVGAAGGSFSSAGGGVLCIADGGSTVALVDSVVLDNTAYVGGGVFLQDCSLDVSRTTLEANTASYGAGLFGYAPTYGMEVTMVDSLVTGNVAVSTGGGMSFETVAASDLYLFDTLVSDNEAYYGGGAALLFDISATCSGSTTVTAGFQGNVGTFGGGALLYSGGYAPTLSASECDFGAAATDLDNLPDDVYVYDSATSYAYEDDATFACDTSSGCL